MSKVIIFVISFLLSPSIIKAQDTLDSIARIKVVIPLDELEMMVELAGKDITKFNRSYSLELEKLANSGNAVAQNLLGECYLLGNGINYDPQKAFFWFSKAVEQKNIRALHNIGYCYENGIGTEKDNFQAFSFYKIAALRGDNSAFNDIAQCYLNGTGTPIDSIKARAWFEKGAEAGIITSQTNAGFLFIAIEGHENYDKAFYWLSKASKHSPNALGLLGMCYENGWGTDVNLPKAQECYRKSYKLGNEDAKSFIK